MGALIIGENIVKSYGEGNDKNTVLNGVSVAVKQGEYVAIMGPSGSGKTTLMYALSGMDGIDSGEVRFDGKSLSGLKESELADLRRQKMGFVFQQPTLLKNLNLMDNIILPSLRDNKGGGSSLAEKAMTLMKKMGIAELAHRGTTQVSGGQLQRAGICRALMGSPNIIFGDEPTGALNSKATGEILDILAGIHEDGTTILLVTHDAAVAARTERVLFMADGKIAGEKQLGKYKPAERTVREAQLSQWLRDMGF